MSFFFSPSILSVLSQVVFFVSAACLESACLSLLSVSFLVGLLFWLVFSLAGYHEMWGAGGMRRWFGRREAGRLFGMAVSLK